MSKDQKAGSSDFMHSFHANTVIGGPAAISQATLAGINQAPMFNPLSHTATIPGPTGIVPSGIYLATSQFGGNAKRMNQFGGWSKEELRETCNNNGISCRGENGGFKHKATLVKQLKKLKPDIIKKIIFKR